MNVLFLTMSTGFTDIETSGIYTDIMRKFRNEGHDVYIICPNERRTGKHTELNVTGKIHCLGVRTLNVTKTNIIEKGIGQLLLERQFKSALKKYFGSVRFDIILYSTPPITFNKVIKYAKAISGERSLTYLLLKDIFPQNAVDLGMMRTTGLRGVLYKVFRNKEKELYRISDWIGCMSPANERYIIEHNPEIDSTKVELSPNSIEIIPSDINFKGSCRIILEKYGLPADKPIFIYGGNLGLPQGIPYLIECLEANSNRKDCHFLVVGSGTYYQKLEDWYESQTPDSVTVLNGLPKVEYDQLVRACQVGLIFLDYRFTIPNFPSRLLSYLENRMPVICATDPNCDMGTIAEDNHFGYYAPSNSVDAFTASVDKMLASDMERMGERGYEYLKANYSVDNTYNSIIKHL